ncbi:hypothetical protein SAMN05720472_2897 [Fibrobacter sp. UWR3]|uniref:hypothetical protein n=1 Tax=Fibrobacter sp. UWR3 TaxID=1896217 RepID=UPI0009117C1B|nr:hypothetical protein [Fibrobacter sp. UWR3]SHM99439.1 hypothetical protein SAMN05720472_2897 [Fibrobacter sp. UWR3]
MLNLKKNLYIAGAFALCALAACSSDNPSSAGSTTMPNATAENSSSSDEVTTSSSDNAITSSADEEINSSSSVNSFVPGKGIVFTTAATSVKKINQGEVTVYGNENGAEATCSAGKYASTKKYLARISIADGETMERTIGLYNFGSACNDIYKAFQESCNSGLVDVAPDAVCSGNGDLKAFCYASKTDSVTTCNARGECVTAGPDSTINFDTLLESFTKESNDICGTIADGVDTTEYDIPKSDPDSSIKANSGRVFILEPNTDKLDVTDEERAVLDSLASAFPEKRRIDEIDGMTIFINDDAEYYFTTEGKKFILNEDDNTCTGNIYAEELGVMRSVSKYGNWRVTNTTTLLVRDIGIVYLVNDGTGSAKEVFQAECEATNGSYYEYIEKAFGCAVKNFTGIPFETIVSEQETLSRNNFNILPEFTPRN